MYWRRKLESQSSKFCLSQVGDNPGEETRARTAGNRQPFTCVMPAWGWGGGVGDIIWNEFLFKRINWHYGR